MGLTIISILQIGVRTSGHSVNGIQVILHQPQAMNPLHRKSETKEGSEGRDINGAKGGREKEGRGRGEERKEGEMGKEQMRGVER